MAICRDEVLLWDHEVRGEKVELVAVAHEDGLAKIVPEPDLETFLDGGLGLVRAKWQGQDVSTATGKMPAGASGGGSGRYCRGVESTPGEECPTSIAEGEISRHG